MARLSTTDRRKANGIGDESCLVARKGVAVRTPVRLEIRWQARAATRPLREGESVARRGCAPSKREDVR